MALTHAAAGTAVAQVAAAPPSPALETIVVTAQKRAEDVQDVGMAVAAFDGETVGDAGVTDAMQLQTVVPSLTYVATGYSAQPYLRGIGTRQFAVGLEPSIATYIDDRYIARPFATIFDLLDLERIEVLKGPQGVLYGRNAAGGAIRAITRDPSSEAAVELGTRVGNYGARRAHVTAGGPLSEAWRGQITAAIDRRDGLATNLVPTGRPTADDVDHQAYRGKLLWDISEAVAAKLTLSWWHYTDWTGRDLTAAGVPEANRGAALYGGVTSYERDRFASAFADDNDLSEAAADLRFDIRLANLDLVSATTYADDEFNQTLDVDVSSTRLIDLLAAEKSETWTQEFQVLSRDGAQLTWLAGAYFYRQDATNLYVFEDAVSAQPALPVGTDLSNGFQSVRTETYALFAQAAYPFNDRWTGTLGARWSREDKTATLESVPQAVLNAPYPYANARDWEETTPRIAIEYRGGFGLAYLSYSRGFKSGGYNYPASLNPVLDPETLDSYEIGVKPSFADDRVRLSTALFFYSFDGLQVTRGGAGAFLTTENAASARVRGLEIDLTAALTADLSISAGFALIDSKYTEYTAGVLVPEMAPPFGSAPLPGGFDARGRSLLRSPEQATYVGFRYERRVGNGGAIPFSLDYSYKGGYYFDFSPVPATEWLRQDAYGILNARVAYTAAGDRWEIGVWGTNLTDTAYYEDAVLTSVSSRVSYADPRMYGIDFTLRL